MVHDNTICQSCGHAIRIDDSASPLSACPSCNKPLPVESKRGKSSRAIHADVLSKFKSVDGQLAERLGGIVPEASWHLAVLSEILDYEYGRLSNTLNQSQAVNNRMFNLKSNKARADVIKKQFQEYSECILEIEEALIRHAESDCKFPGSVDFWAFYEAISQSFDRLAQFHQAVVGLKFVRDSAENEIQGMMIDWVHHVIICLESLKKQLDRKSKLEPPQLKVRTVEVTLASPNLHLLFDRLEKLSDAGRLPEPDHT